MADVLVVGAGPVGLTLACELARHGVRSRIIDRAPQPSTYCRAIGVTPRTLEVWDDMGVAREMIDAGIWLTGLRSIIDGRPIPDAIHPDLGLPYASLGLPQYETERILTRHLERFSIGIERGYTLDPCIRTPRMSPRASRARVDPPNRSACATWSSTTARTARSGGFLGSTSGCGLSLAVHAR